MSYLKYIALLVISMSAIQVCHADIVIMKNGDRLTGKVTSMKSDKLTIKTEYHAEVNIPWDQIRTLLTDRQIIVILDDGSRLNGKAVAAEQQDEMRINNTQIGSVSVPFASVKEIRLSPKPPVVLHGHLNVAARTTRGNSKTDSYHGDGEVVARTLKSRYTLGFATNFGKNDGDVSQQDTLGYVRYDYFLTQKWFLNSNFSVLHDRFRDLNLRTTVGLGAGHQFFEGEQLNLSVEGGVNYINEDFNNAPDDRRAAARWAMNYQQSFFDGKLTAFHYDEVLIGFTAPTKEILATLRNGFRFPLFMKFVGTLQLNIDFNNDPAPGDKKADLAYILGVGYEF